MRKYRFVYSINRNHAEDKNVEAIDVESGQRVGEYNSMSWTRAKRGLIDSIRNHEDIPKEEIIEI